MTFWRLLVVALVLVNVLLAAARVLAPPAPLPDGIPPAPDAPSIALVGELIVDGDEAALCFSIGPLASELQRQRATDRLRPFVETLRERETVADTDHGWWVYLPPEGSRQDALALARTLADAGVEDYFVVTSGEMENTISLGLFESPDNARVRQGRIRALGFDAQVAVRREEAPRYWVDYRARAGESVPWRPVLRASPGARHLGIPCFESSSAEVARPQEL